MYIYIYYTICTCIYIYRYTHIGIYVCTYAMYIHTCIIRVYVSYMRFFFFLSLSLYIYTHIYIYMIDEVCGVSRDREGLAMVLKGFGSWNGLESGGWLGVPELRWRSCVCLPPLYRAPNKPQKLQGSHILVLRSSIRGIPEIAFCRILTFMWSFWALL